MTVRTRVEIKRSDVGLSKVFEVYNTSHRSLLVLAKDWQTAQSIAWSAAHIYHSDSGLDGEHRQIHEVKSRMTNFSDENWLLLENAVNEGRQGTVVVINGRVLIGDTELTR